MNFAYNVAKKVVESTPTVSQSQENSVLQSYDKKMENTSFLNSYNPIRSSASSMTPSTFTPSISSFSNPNKQSEYAMSITSRSGFRANNGSWK